MQSIAGEYFKRKKVILTLAAIVLFLVIGSGIYILYGNLSEPTPEDIMEEIVRENSDAVISVGIWQNSLTGRKARLSIPISEVRWQAQEPL